MNHTERDDAETFTDLLARHGAELPCRTADPELFFAETSEDVDRARATCDGCPIRAECLAGAVERREPWGVWGGELFKRGAIVGRRRRPARPSRPRPNSAPRNVNLPHDTIDPDLVREALDAVRERRQIPADVVLTTAERAAVVNVARAMGLDRDRTMADYAAVLRVTRRSVHRSLQLYPGARIEAAA